MRILDLASWKTRLILDDLATVLHQPQLGFFDVADRDFEHRSQRRASLDEYVDAIAMQADHVRLLASDSNPSCPT